MGIQQKVFTNYNPKEELRFTSIIVKDKCFSSVGQTHKKLTSNTLVSYSTITTVVGLVTFLWKMVVYHRHSHNTANARVHHGHTMLVRTSVYNAKTTKTTRGILLQEFLSTPGRFWGYFIPYHCLLESVALCPFLGLFTALNMANLHTLSDGRIQDVSILKILIAILRSLISTPFLVPIF